MIKRASLLRRGPGIVLAGLLLAGGSELVAVPAASASAAVPNTWGFGYLNNPNPAPGFVLPAATEASSSGRAAVVTAHPGAGVYQISFQGIGAPAAAPGVVHVTAAPSGRVPVWCQASQWGPAAGNEVIDILCYRPRAGGGVATNTAFSVVFTSSSLPAPAGIAYGYLESTGGNGTVTQFDSDGGVITSALVGPGSWQVTMPGLGGGPGPLAGGIQVTTATARATHCKLETWTNAAQYLNIDVACFDPAGAPSDVRWNLTYQDGRDITGRATANFGYIWNTAAPPGGTNVNSRCLPGNAITHPAAGLYTVTFPCIFAPPDNVLLSASGANTDFCSLSSPGPWIRAGANVDVPHVFCFHVNGAISPADDFFTTYTSR
jgi:hypothetical protein